MKQLMLAAITLSFWSIANAKGVDIKLIKFPSQEVTTYQATNRPFDINVSAARGWKKCTVMPIQEFTKRIGNTDVQFMNIKLYCFTTSDHMVSQDCAVNQDSRVDFRRFSLTATGSKVNTVTDSISADSAVTFELSCNF